MSCRDDSTSTHPISYERSKNIMLKVILNNGKEIEVKNKVKVQYKNGDYLEFNSDKDVYNVLCVNMNEVMFISIT